MKLKNHIEMNATVFTLRVMRHRHYSVAFKYGCMIEYVAQVYAFVTGNYTMYIRGIYI